MNKELFYSTMEKAIKTYNLKDVQTLACSIDFNPSETDINGYSYLHHLHPPHQSHKITTLMKEYSSCSHELDHNKIINKILKLDKNPEIIKILVEKKVNPSSTLDQPCTPLHCFLKRMPLDVFVDDVRMLCIKLEIPSSPTTEKALKNCQKIIPDKIYSRIAQSLIPYNRHPSGLLHKIGKKLHDPTILSFHIKAGARVDEKNKHDETILHTLIRYGKLKMIKELFALLPKDNNKKLLFFILLIGKTKKLFPKPIVLHIAKHSISPLKYAILTEQKLTVSKLQEVKNKQNKTALALAQEEVENAEKKYNWILRVNCDSAYQLKELEKRKKIVSFLTKEH